MKRTLSTITLLCMIPFLGFAEESEDPRFKNGDNLYEKELTNGMMKAFGCKGWELVDIQKVTKVGSTHIVDFSIALKPEPAIPPVTEKDFEKLKEFIEPFFKGQVELYKKAGKDVSVIGYSFPTPSYAKDYTKDELPTMFFSIDGKDTNWFLMKVAFTERKDDVLVIQFTIVAVE